MTRREWFAAFVGAILAMFGRWVTPKECEEWFGRERVLGAFQGVNRSPLVDLKAALRPATWRGREFPPTDPVVLLMHPRDHEKVQRWWREDVG